MDQQAPWDILTGVGLTALAVAAGRAIETSRPEALVSDPYAKAFVQAAHAPMPILSRLDTAMDPRMVWMSTYMGVRSRFFDDFFAGASAADVKQVVLLAAGLDTRAFRLSWPPDTTLYELDAPKVLEFKDRVLTEQGARARCRRRTVAVDLRADWPTTLQQAGFDARRPTAWLAEGLLPFLSDESKESLFGRIHRLSTAGSQIAVEEIGDDIATLLRNPLFDDAAEQFGLDMAALFPPDQHFDAAQWLADKGWTVRTTRAVEVAQHYGRPLEDPIRPLVAINRLITAVAPSPASTLSERCGQDPEDPPPG